METITCPTCQQTDRQVKIGRTTAGSQRYLCAFCQRKYTPHPKSRGYAAAQRQQALQLYLDGLNLRRIGRTLGVVHQTVANWVAAYAATLPDEPLLPARPATRAGTPELLDVVEFDELFTYEGEKKTASTSSPTSTAPRAASSPTMWPTTGS